MRVKFRKGEQRKFIIKVLEEIACPNLRSLLERGFSLNYQTLKSYFNENRTLPEDLVDDLCFLAKIDKKSLKAVYLKDHWGQKLGPLAAARNRRMKNKKDMISEVKGGKKQLGLNDPTKN